MVRATGDLDDTVEQFNRRTGKGTGFKFIEYKARAFLHSIKQAVKTYPDWTAWEAIVRNGMSANFPWEESARKYMAIYATIT